MTFPDRGLYAITDGPRKDLVAAAAAALAGGARLLQYRDKSADVARRLDEVRALKRLCDAHEVPLIVNDDIALAKATDAAGVHLGEHDADPVAARAVLGPRAIIGVSCYDSLERARAAVAAGASYVAFGAFFASPTKPQARRATLDLLRHTATLGVPRVAIGGITLDNAPLLIEAGADYLAVISALFGAADVTATARRFAGLYAPSFPGKLVDDEQP